MKETDDNEDVVSEKTEPIKAFERFGGKVFDPSQPIGKQPAQVYDATRKEDAKFESPLQKFKRLKSEIAEFKGELDDIAARVCFDAKLRVFFLLTCLSGVLFLLFICFVLF